MIIIVSQYHLFSANPIHFLYHKDLLLFFHHNLFQLVYFFIIIRNNIYKYIQINKYNKHKKNLLYYPKN